MSKAAPRGYKNAGSDSYASTSGNLDLFDKTKDHFGLNGQNGQVIKREPTQQRVRGRCDKCCTVFLFILLVICVLIGAGGIALCIVYFNTDSSTTGFKIGGIVLGVVTCIVGIILIILTIFKQTHKRPWKQKKEKNFFYAQDYRKNPEKDGQKNIENLMDSGSQMYIGNNDNNPNRNNTRSINNNSGQLNNSFVASHNSFGPLSTSNGGQSTKNTYVNPSTSKTTYVNPPIVDYVDNQPVMYSLSGPPPEPIVTSVVEPTQLRTGNSNPVQYQTITTKPTQQDLITFPAQNQPVVATPLQEYVAVSRPMQRTNQTTRQDLIYFTSEDEEKALRNRGTFTSFDRPVANSTLRSSQSDIIPSTRSNITESVVVRRVPIPTTKVITHQQQQQQPPSTKVIIVKVPNVAGQLVMQPSSEQTHV
ncbi:hypothetical protein I4U23_017769 [Adineta vaga]|nr:hypothetical protein I4U23_017769 [Adineta vaga]